MDRPYIPSHTAEASLRARIRELCDRLTDRVLAYESLAMTMDASTDDAPAAAGALCAVELAALNDAIALEAAADVVVADTFADYTAAMGIQAAAQMVTNSRAMEYQMCLTGSP